ncbi:MAG: phosphotransferase [Nocardioidaceae bacterium]
MPDPALAEAVAAAFGLSGAAALEGPVARGQQGRVWRLTCGTRVLAVKESFDGFDVAEAEADAAFQDVVRAAAVPMPAVARTVGGGVVAEVGGHAVRAYEWVDVRSLDRSSYDVAAVGALVAAIHRVRVPCPAGSAVRPWYAEPVGEPAWRALVGRLASAGAPFAEELDALVPGIVEVESWIAGVAAVQLCHLDLWADNVRTTPSGWLVVLDWENAGPGDPSQELGPVLYEFGLGDSSRTAQLWEAYVEAGGPGRPRGPDDLGMLVAQLGHILEIGCESWLAATDDPQRAGHEAWVREYLDDPPTRSRLLGILAALG